MKNLLNLVGEKYGRYTVIERIDGRFWKCRCDCGTERAVVTGNLRNGNSKSCGCLQRENTSKAKRVHGDARTRLYRAWGNMIWRCRSDFKQATDYAERGITVCDEWASDYGIFKAWSLLNGYADHLTLDRRDNDGNYEPTNCQWVTRREQQGNTRACHYVEIDGQEVCLTEAARRKNLSVSTVRKRLRLGWPVDRALSEPPKH